MAKRNYHQNNEWPIYYKDRLVVSNLNSNVGIVTLWTPKEIITDKLDKNSFAIAGQLYSKRGVNYLLRNILANPSLDTLLICGADRSGSADALVELVKSGIDTDHKVIGVKHSDIHKEIDKESIEQFRKNVRIIDLRNKVNIGLIKETLNSCNKSISNWSAPRVFDEPEVVMSDSFLSEKTTFSIRSGYIKEAWPQMLEHIMKFGSEKGMIKVGALKELVNLVVTITDEDPDSPELVEEFGFDENDLKKYYKAFFSSEKGDKSYSYGNRLNLYKVDDLEINQLKVIYNKLKNYKYDRGAVGLIWNAFEDNEAFLNKSEVNVPCMNYIQFIYRNKKLHLNAYFRSNDIYAAWPRNAFGLRKLQFAMAGKLKMRVGNLTTISALSQVYENDYQDVIKIVKSNKSNTYCLADQRTSIIIEIDGDEIVARVMSPDGNKQMGEIREKATLYKSSTIISDKLIREFYFQTQYHATDIGMELTKAEICYKNNMEYVQDKSWEELVKINKR